MAHQIFNQIQKVKSAASKLEGVNKIFGTSDYSGLMRHNLNYEVKKLRNVIDDARREHGQGFQPDGYKFYSAIDLMEMGY
jgi:hypothetical protein